jgi:HlyD family secretion protein
MGMRSAPVLLTAAAAAMLWSCTGESGAADRGTVVVRRGTLTRHAVAVGRVEAEREVMVKSRNGGILTKLLVRLGQRVKQGDPLAEVQPVITNIDLIRAERAVAAARRGEEAAEEYARGEHLAAKFMSFFQGEKNVQRMLTGARLGREQAEEQLKLLREGKIEIDEREVDSVVRAPASGHVVAIVTREGAPVVPSSSYGSGTVLMILADLEQLVFRGTVDEIDVGRMRVGMTADVEIGALPGVRVTGVVDEIGLRAKRQNDAVVFDVRLDLTFAEGHGAALRSGYSAVAEVVTAERDDVLVVPERVVTFRGGKAFVTLADGSAGGTEVEIEAGISDGLQVEVINGLEEGAALLERR